MLTKRAAIIAIYSGVLAKMAHADDPNWMKPKPDPLVAQLGLSTTIVDWNRPNSWTVNLDMVTALNVIKDGETVTISAAELFAALKS